MDSSQNLEIYLNASEAIKAAILKSQAQAAKLINREQLALYFGIGKYLSNNSRRQLWGSAALDCISENLLKTLPGLRGFSSTNLKLMRIFYEQWKVLDTNSSILTDENCLNGQNAISSVATDEQVLDDFVKKPNENPSIGIILCKSAEKSYVEYAIRDYKKPMGVSTFKTVSDMPEKLRKVLPDIEGMRKLLDNN